ncbi:fluoride efflux transporter CrcB [Luteimonas sp. 100069]|nr:fluoride efflux transporter CrcB [Luteimonas sp. 100069]
MQRLMLIALGGAFGSVCRYGLSLWTLQLAGANASTSLRFPLGTLTVNLLGCFVAGLLAGGIVRHEWFTPDVRVMLLVGVMGGFTTFSAFGLDTLALLRRGDIAMAGLYIAASVLCGLALAALGWWITSRGAA